MTAEVMVIAGYALLHGELLDPEVRRELAPLGDPVEGVFGALFIYDHDEQGRQQRWTLFTSDGPYARLLTEAGRTEASAELLRQKFPAFQSGWSITGPADSSTT